MERVGSGAAKSLFPSGPTFTIDEFSKKAFIVRDFVDALTESATPANRRSGPSEPSFHPKQLIRTFEKAQAQLTVLSEQLQAKESDLLSQVRRAEIQHDQTLDTLGRKLDQTMAAFEALDVSVNNPVGDFFGPGGAGGDGIDGGGGRPDASINAAVYIGERIEELDRQRRRARDANFLIQCWLEVSGTGELTALEEIQRQGGADNKLRCAATARQLTKISQRLDSPSWAQSNGEETNGVVGGGKRPNTREVLEKFCETVEQDLLRQFNSSYRRQQFDQMLECARVLHDFNGGASVIATFVNQHQFFIDRDQLITDEVSTDGNMWDQLADPDSEAPGVELSLQSLVDEVRIVMQEESFVIRRAFPFYDTVLVKFLQRIFQQSIQQRLEKVLAKADTISSLAFLRSLHSSRAYIGGLIDDLKSHGLTEHPEPCSAQISLALDQQMEELFVPYLVGASYIERERRSLEVMYNALLFKYTMYHSRRKKAPTGFMATLAQQGTQLLASAKDTYLERLGSSDQTATQKAMMLRVAGLKEAGGNNKNEIEVTEEDAVLQVANAKRMMTWLAESVRRVLELGSAADLPKDVGVLLNLLLTSMGQVYVETTLDAAMDAAALQENAKTEPDLGYLPPIRPAATMAGLMDRFITTVLIRLAESNTAVRRSMEAQKKSSLEVIERKVNNVVRTTINVVANWVAKLLSGQKKQDFRPRDEELDSLHSATCLTICAFLSRAWPLVARALDGSNLEKAATELAMTVLRLVADHLKKFAVNAMGGLVVTQDIAKYVAVLKAWSLRRDVEAAVDLLSEIGSLFIVGPEALREKARALATTTAGGTFAVLPLGAGRGLTKADFRAFVMRRDDSNSAEIQSVLATL